MTITATEFQINLGRYLAFAEAEDNIASRKNKTGTRAISDNQERIEAMKSLFGCIPADITLEEAREERLGKI